MKTEIFGPRRSTRFDQKAREAQAGGGGDADAAREVGAIGPSCRLVHVADRGADVFGFMAACVEAGAGFLIRAVHDRVLEGEGGGRLWPRLESRPVLDHLEVKVSAQKSGASRHRRRARDARVALRAAAVGLAPPRNDPRFTGCTPRGVWAVFAAEEHPPEGVRPVEWMLLTSEPVETAEDARRVVGWYARRWLIEEFHRVEKEGCRLESVQFDEADDIRRVAAVTAVVAVELLRLRDAADPRSPDADRPGALRELVDDASIRVVSILTGTRAEDLTPRLFLDALARRGGWLGRRHDPRPGWKCLWYGWLEITLMAQGFALSQALGP